MTSSTSFTPIPTPELRSGDLTRFGDHAVLGDAVTERALNALVEDARAAARSQGYAVGWAEGRREAAAEAARVAGALAAQELEARQRWEARQQDGLQALARAAAALERAVTEAQAVVHGQAVDLARELTETMVGHELRSAPDPAADVASRVLAEAPADQPYVLRVHPDVAASVALAGLAESGVRVVPDAGMELHDAVVEVDHQLLDLRVSAALARVREALA